MTGIRKFISFLVFIGVTAVMRGFGWIEDSTYLELNSLALWLYIGANLAEHLGPAAKDLIGKIGVKG